MSPADAKKPAGEPGSSPFNQGMPIRSAISVRDLLDARDAYHVHLSNMDNVVATAIGLFRYRPGDEAYREPGRTRSDRRAKSKKRVPRTLGNSVVNEKSGPAVLVFVRKWIHIERIAPHQYIPPALYLPDGRVVRTCVIEVERDDRVLGAPRVLQYPRTWVGGGYPVLTEVQGETRFGTIGCLVSDGGLNFALTARHVAGRTGQIAETVLGGVRQRIGVSDHVKAEKNMSFDEVYPGWKGTHCFLNLDAGLIRLDSMDEWTSQIYGLGELDPPLNLTPENMSLDLIGTKVRARGAAGGDLRGEVHALFYRYRSVGGIDFVTDVLIGPRHGQKTFAPMHGDSGALWVLDPDPSGTKGGDGREVRARRPGGESRESGMSARRWTPLAMQWGGHKYVGDTGQGKYCFALGTFLSTACRTLDVEVVRGWEIGLPEYWGKPIHYQIAYHAWNLLPEGDLKTLIERNMQSIGSKAGTAPDGDGDFFPLADAPDRWAFGFVRPQDAPNHSANLDLFDGKKRLDKCRFAPKAWADFYDRIGTNPKERGALPFRVGQVFDAMAKAVNDGDLDRTVFSAGVLAHYAGDIAMPLHGITDYKGEKSGTPRNTSTNVHKFYDRLLLEGQPETFTPLMEQWTRKKTMDPGGAAREIGNGRDAAAEALRLMIRVSRKCPSDRLFEVYTQWWDSKTGHRRDYETAWDRIGTDVSGCAFLGARFIARLWLAAWTMGGRNPKKKIRPARADAARLGGLFADRKELESVSLEKLDALLGYTP